MQLGSQTKRETSAVPEMCRAINAMYVCHPTPLCGIDGSSTRIRFQGSGTRGAVHFPLISS
eukprot:7995675-Prorocentrum_lima.AAC.1